MNKISRTCLSAFEIVNEMYMAISAGILGAVYISKLGFERSALVRTLTVGAITSISLYYITRHHSKKLKPSKKNVVYITGCDSGLGFSLAQHTVDMGFTVIAGFLNLDSKGCKALRKKYGSNIIQIQLDITDDNTISASVKTLQHFFSRNPDYSLHAIVNNAGVMVFGEFEWLTDNLIRHQINVNLMGTFKFTNVLCPLLRYYKGRVITITSHCAKATLPGLAVYGATKAALAAFNDGFRVEMAKYGVKVIGFIPGSFTLQSNIMANQVKNIQEMHDHFTEEQHDFYNDYFKKYNMYLSFIKPPRSPVKIEDKNLYCEYEKALLDENPKVLYKNENWRYFFYHTLFKISPWRLRDYFVTKFMAMPPYEPPQSRSNNYFDSISDSDL